MAVLYRNQIFFIVVSILSVSIYGSSSNYISADSIQKSQNYGLETGLNDSNYSNPSEFKTSNSPKTFASNIAPSQSVGSLDSMKKAMDVTICSSSIDGKISVCKVQGTDSSTVSQFACTNQINSTWNCVEITEKTSSDHYNKIKDAIKKSMELKSQGADAVNNFGR